MPPRQTTPSRTKTPPRSTRSTRNTPTAPGRQQSRSPSLPPPIPERIAAAPTPDHVRLAEEWIAKKQPTDPVFAKKNLRQLERQIAYSLQSYDHCPSEYFPPIAAKYGLNRWMPTKLGPVKSRGPVCRVNGKAETSCHKPCLPAFMYTLLAAPTLIDSPTTHGLNADDPAVQQSKDLQSRARTSTQANMEVPSPKRRLTNTSSLTSAHQALFIRSQSPTTLSSQSQAAGSQLALPVPDSQRVPALQLDPSQVKRVQSEPASHHIPLPKVEVTAVDDLTPSIPERSSVLSPPPLKTAALSGWRQYNAQAKLRKRTQSAEPPTQNVLSVPLSSITPTVDDINSFQQLVPPNDVSLKPLSPPHSGTTVTSISPSTSTFETKSPSLANLAALRLDMQRPFSAAIDGANQLLHSVEQNRHSFAQSLDNIINFCEELQNQARQDRHSIISVRAERDQLKNTLRTLDNRLLHSADLLAMKDDAISKQTGQISFLEQHVERLLREEAAVGQRLREAVTEREAALEERDAARMEYEAMRSMATRAKKEMQDANAAQDVAEAALEEADAEVQQLTSELQQAKAMLKTLQADTLTSTQAIDIPIDAGVWIPESNDVDAKAPSPPRITMSESLIPSTQTFIVQPPANESSSCDVTQSQLPPPHIAPSADNHSLGVDTQSLVQSTESSISPSTKVASSVVKVAPIGGQAAESLILQPQFDHSSLVHTPHPSNIPGQWSNEDDQQVPETPLHQDDMIISVDTQNSSGGTSGSQSDS
ncbi:hypothetical protein TREMEDRAFT_65570 [Tremella mesenterica DSM 1558]|uniref:uncharacterized protein n=1 Tax=Tremella mesenterica (strain ATCC 24925 / CBS 8224 / DSM 1558 / NBRC 9311 / NRRL Y-6157 / RJB 2259-6 / UBC 559-6) TaxID=578456 RepID=UPI00032C008C|nr:uncharacterized protein TREMEDRAFT_65570 [Tremella mesenterica DSM 1558]EIW66299.1 hypothetical protein TREMEDRAFT_65570 [Tremella mesenterica DSM 1558]